MLGNASLMGAQENTGEPFFFLFQCGKLNILLGEEGEHTLRITINGLLTHKLNDEYLETQVLFVSFAEIGDKILSNVTYETMKKAYDKNIFIIGKGKFDETMLLSSTSKENTFAMNSVSYHVDGIVVHQYELSSDNVVTYNSIKVTV
jgi:hypothetical protein